MQMLACKRKVVATAVVVAVFVCAPIASAAEVSYTPDEYKVFAGSDLTIGADSQIWGRAGAGLDALVYASAMIIYDGTAGDLLVNDDVDIRYNVRITGRVMAFNTNVSDATIDGILTADAPAPFPQLEYVSIGGRIDSWGEVDIGVASTVGGSIFQKGSDRDVYLRENVTVAGVMHINNTQTGGGKPWFNVHSTATVSGPGGSIYEGEWKITKLDGTFTSGVGPPPPSATEPDTYAFSLRDESEAAFDETGVTDVLYGDGETVVVSPGTYRDLDDDGTGGEGATLRLSAGTYYFRDISLASTANIIADTSAGDVIIIAFSDLTTLGSNILSRVGQGNVVIRVGDDLTIGANSTIDADLLAYSYDVYGETSILTIGNDTWVLGMVYSEDDVVIGDRVVIPEPGTLMLLGVGAVCMLLKRRRRRGRA